MGRGATIACHRPYLHYDDSLVHQPLSYELVTNHETGDVPEPEDVKDLKDDDVNPVKPAREIFFNTPCYYFWHSKTGCTRPDCHFLHDEYTTVTNKKTQPAHVEVKVYVRNIPFEMNKNDLARIIEKHGYIKHIYIPKSRLESRRQAAIVIMTDEDEASAAIAALNLHVDHTGEKLSAEKQLAEPRKEEVSHQSVDEPLPAFSALGKERDVARNKASSPTSVLSNPWCVLCDDENEKPDLAEKKNGKKKAPQPATTTTPLTGAWAVATRTWM